MTTTETRRTPLDHFAELPVATEREIVAQARSAGAIAEGHFAVAQAHFRLARRLLIAAVVTLASACGPAAPEAGDAVAADGPAPVLTAAPALTLPCAAGTMATMTWSRPAKPGDVFAFTGPIRITGGAAWGAVIVNFRIGYNCDPTGTSCDHLQVGGASLYPGVGGVPRSVASGFAATAPADTVEAAFVVQVYCPFANGAIEVGGLP